jgi:hypothetical protein
MLVEHVEQHAARRRHGVILRLGVRVNEPGAPMNGRAITRPTSYGPRRSARAVSQILYSSHSGMTSSCAATWKTLSADVYTIGEPVRMCSAPSSLMISVPEAALLPSVRRRCGARIRP